MAKITVLGIPEVKPQKDNEQYKKIIAKLSHLKPPAYLQVEYSDVHDNEEEFSEAIKMLKSAGHKVETSFKYDDSVKGIRGETVHTALIYPKK